jgi:hypothetical protein
MSGIKLLYIQHHRSSHYEKEVGKQKGVRLKISVEMELILKRFRIGGHKKSD